MSNFINVLLLSYFQKTFVYVSFKHFQFISIMLLCYTVKLENKKSANSKDFYYINQFSGKFQPVAARGFLALGGIDPFGAFPSVFLSSFPHKSRALKRRPFKPN